MQKFKLLPMIAIVLLIVSCKKDKSLNEEQQSSTQVASIMKQPQAEQIKYAEANLKKIAKSFGILAKNPAFVDYVQREVAKKFGDEYVALIQTMQKNSTWASQLNTKEINEGLAAFKNLEGSNFYPQIYIPKMQHDEDNNVSNYSAQSNTTSTDDVKICVYAGGDSLPNLATASFPGYEINDEDSLVAWGPVNEVYADNNEVWVFSLNEIVDNEGRLVLPSGECGPNSPDYPDCLSGVGGGGSGGGSGGGGDVDSDPVENALPNHPAVDDEVVAQSILVKCRIEKMKVFVTYEPWISGKSEVSIKAQLSCHNNRDFGNINLATQQYKSKQYSNHLGKLIWQFTRKQIRNGTEVDVNYNLQWGWPTQNAALSNPIFFDYAIFERDLWPTGIRIIDMGKRKDFFLPSPLLSADYVTYPRAGLAELGFGFVTNSLYSKGAITNTLSSLPLVTNFTVAPFNNGKKTMFYSNGFDAGEAVATTQVGPIINFNVIAY